MSRNELITIGQRIKTSDGTEAEIDALQDLFSQHLPHPAGASLFFYPEHYNSRTDDLTDYNPSVEEVVDKCLAYRPIQL